jgi:hypothetical protein
MHGELRIPAHRLSVPCDVIADNEQDDAVSLHFTAEIELPAALRGMDALAA